MLKEPLYKVFDLVYGTSTGAIITSMLALGDNIKPTICKRYFEIAPDVMGKHFAKSRTNALYQHAQTIFEDRKFSDFCVNVGIVCTNLESSKPTVFKTTAIQAAGRVDSFVPGFDCSIAEAVVSSCAARPFFEKRRLDTPNHGQLELIDGGFVANNPTLFALADALGPLQIPRENVRVLSLGTGRFPSRCRPLVKMLELFSPTIMTLATASSHTVETVRQLFFGKINTLRINEAFTDNRYRTDFIESRMEKLRTVYQLGSDSFGSKEQEIRRFFDVS